MNANRKQIRLFLKCLGSLIFGTITTSSFGQDVGGKSLSEAEIRQDTVVVDSKNNYSVVTNMFWDNWFVGIGAGAQFHLDDHDKQMKFTRRLTPAFSFYVGKWFSPEIGVRASISGFELKGLTQQNIHSTNEVYDVSKRLEIAKFRYLNTHADVLFNLSNILAGYKENRFYTVGPYVGFGWIQTLDEPIAKEVSANIGLFNTFRLGEAIDFTIGVLGVMTNDRFDGEVGGRKQEGLLSATAGIVYRFKKRGWEKPKTTVISYDEAALAALRGKMAKLDQDNEALKKLLSNSKTDTVTELKVKNRVLVAPILITFQINRSIISDEARVNIGFFAKIIKENRSEVIYKITGYADKGTGTAKTNQRLSQERVEAVYRVLVREFGISPTQLEVFHEGGTDNMFYDDPSLSRCVIAIAK